MKQAIEQQRKVIAVLEAARAKIFHPANWTQGAWARNKEGEPTNPRGEGATCFCSLGAVKSATNWGDGIFSNVSDSLTRAGGAEDNFIHYNDNHTHEEVLAMFNKAIEYENNVLITMNLKELIAAVEAYPEELFNLETFTDKKLDEKGNVCGTLFCTAGLATTLPVFQDIGFKLEARNNGWGSGITACVDGVEVLSGGADATFGTDSFDNLFDQRNSEVDYSHPAALSIFADEDEVDEEDDEKEVPAFITDKALALWRLNRQLAIYEGELV